MLVEVNDASDADLRRSEEHCAGDETTSSSIDSTSSHESNPVEVVESPEAREKDTTSDATLFFGSVQANSVEETELQPCGTWVAMSKSGFILVPVSVARIVQFGIVSVVVATVLGEQFLVSLSEVLLEVDLALTFLPLTELFLSPVVLTDSTHFNLLGQKLIIIITLDALFTCFMGFWPFEFVGFSLLFSIDDSVI